MGAEVRAILAEAVREPDTGFNLAEAIMARFQGLKVIWSSPTALANCRARWSSIFEETGIELINP
jgi:hypothetical protein